MINPILSAAPPNYGVTDSNSFITVDNDQNRILYAQGVYVVNDGTSTLVSAVSSYSQSKTLSATPTVTAGAYATGNVIGSGVIALSGATRNNGGGGTIQSVCVTSRVALAVGVDVVFFNANPSNTTFTDRSAAAIAAADSPKIIGAMQIMATDFISLGTPSAGQTSSKPVAFNLPSGTTLYACMISRGAFTPTGTSDITLNVGIYQD